MQGRLTLVGDWPAATQFVAVALFPHRPTTEDPVLPVDFQTFETPPAEGYVDYLLENVAPGEYGYLVAAWIGAGSDIFVIDSWVILDEYTLPGDPGTPAVVTVIDGQMTTIDLTGDLDLVPRTGGLHAAPPRIAAGARR